MKKLSKQAKSHMHIYKTKNHCASSSITVSRIGPNYIIASIPPLPITATTPICEIIGILNSSSLHVTISSVSISVFKGQDPRSSFQSAGVDPLLLNLFKCSWGVGGAGEDVGLWTLYNNGLPGADSIFFNTVRTHQSFLFNSLSNNKGVISNKKV